MVFFENSIIKITRQVSKNFKMSLNTKEQLNSMIIIFLQKLRDIIIKFERKKLNMKIITNILFMFLSGDLLKNSLKEGNQSIEYFNKCDKLQTRQQKARVLISPSSIEKELNVKMSKEISIFVASVVEYIIAEIISVSIILMKHKRININDINEGIKQDAELSNFLTKIKVKFLPPHKLVLAKSSFQRIIKMSTDKKISNKAIILIQQFIETYIIKILVKANLIKKHTRRLTLLPSDIQILKTLLTEPYDIYSITKPNDINLLEIKNTDE